MTGNPKATRRDWIGLAVIARALLVSCVTLGIFLLQWGTEKFAMPRNTPAIWDHFHGLSVPQAAAYIFGVIEIVLTFCLFLGIARTVAYGAAMILHAVSVIVSWRQLIDLWGDHANQFFVAGVPVLGAFVALFLLRDADRHAPSSDASSRGSGAT